MRKYHTTLQDFSIVEDNILTPEEANAKEIYYIEYYNSYYNGYNSTLGGNSGFQRRGENHPSAKLSDAEVEIIRKIRSTKQYTFQEVFFLYKDKLSLQGF